MSSSLVCELGCYENSFLWIWGRQACSLSMHLICRGALGHFTALELDAHHCAPAESLTCQCGQELAGNSCVCCDSFSTAKLQPIGVHPRSSSSFLGQDLIICICMYYSQPVLHGEVSMAKQPSAYGGINTDPTAAQLNQSVSSYALSPAPGVANWQPGIASD